MLCRTSPISSYLDYHKSLNFIMNSRSPQILHCPQSDTHFVVRLRSACVHVCMYTLYICVCVCSRMFQLMRDIYNFIESRIYVLRFKMGHLLLAARIVYRFAYTYVSYISTYMHTYIFEYILTDRYSRTEAVASFSC